MNPRMLTTARDAQGLTQKELGEACRIPQSRLSKAESGIVELTSDELQRLAKRLDVTVALLSWSDEVHGFGSASFFHRKQQSLSQKTLRKIQAQVNFLRMRLQRLYQGIEVDADRAIPSMNPDEHDGPEEVARRLRAYWQLPMGPVGNMVNAIENAGGVIFRNDFGTHRINAISVWHPGAPALFVVNSTLTPEQQRFVLAHELGHMVMHEGFPPRDYAEREADRFAEEFLMPAASVTSDLRGIDLKRAATLKPYWKVSMQSLILRAEHLGLINSGRCRSLHAYMNKLGYLPVEPFPVEREEPSVLVDMVQVHLDDHEYTTKELADVLGMPRNKMLDDFTKRGQRPLRVVS
ncbi:helix-turn-helix domain-containing protein [Actinokineospora bangkokensis]|uniref:helix-turn-helix domain-containing protein n=1 Tax=Actinokineospora bangkokensis TaxID=1193682 RepID=UPI00096B2F5C|nr:XRE family transcriptional regulator [Actinokineospora bangkokensis]